MLLLHPKYLPHSGAKSVVLLFFFFFFKFLFFFLFLLFLLFWLLLSLLFFLCLFYIFFSFFLPFVLVLQPHRCASDPPPAPHPPAMPERALAIKYIRYGIYWYDIGCKIYQIKSRAFSTYDKVIYSYRYMRYIIYISSCMISVLYFYCDTIYNVDLIWFLCFCCRPKKWKHSVHHRNMPTAQDNRASVGAFPFHSPANVSRCIVVPGITRRRVWCSGILADKIGGINSCRRGPRTKALNLSRLEYQSAIAECMHSP